eukprot:gene2485-2826_t
MTLEECFKGKKINRLLLTGAAGGLGKVMREQLKEYTRVMRLSDLVEMAPAKDETEEVVLCDLADKGAVYTLMEGCDAVVHLGGVSVERPFEEVLEANIKGVFNIYDAARRCGVKRIVFASSNHVIGFYKQTDYIDANAARRPDGYYGLSKSFGEDMAQFHYDRWQIETVSIRIGSSFLEPANRRMMSTWLSYRDLTSLIVRSLFTPNVRHTIVYGVSNNEKVWWDNKAASHLGYVGQDSSEAFRSKIEAQPPVQPTDPNAIYQGGAFTAKGPFDDAA